MGTRDRIIAIAPWGDTYTAEDIENGCMPLEARFVDEDDAAGWQDEEAMIAAHIAQQELEEAARLDALDAEREARYSAGDWGDPADYY